MYYEDDNYDFEFEQMKTKGKGHWDLRGVDKVVVNRYGDAGASQKIAVWLAC